MKVTNDHNILSSARLYASGRVQGVGFRKFTLAAAQGLSLSGRVRNLSDGRVEVDVTGTRPQITALVTALRQGPPRSEVHQVDLSWCKRSQPVSQFLIDD